MSDVSTWSTTAADNNEDPPNGFPENQSPSSLNNCMREVMAAVARMYASLPAPVVSTLSAANATPSVAGISNLYLNVEGGFTITGFTNGYTSQLITLYNQNSSAVTIDCTGTNIKSIAGTDLTMLQNTWRSFRRIDGTVWVEV